MAMYGAGEDREMDSYIAGKSINCDHLLEK